MKKLFLALLLFVGVIASVSAQSASVCKIEPNPASATGTIDDIDVPTDAHITNLTNSIIHMKWERTVISLTPGCETAVCDPNTCWARFISTKNFDMDPNETGEMLVHFYNNSAPCAGIIHVKVTNRDNPADTTIAVYLFNQSSSGTNDLPKAEVKLFPNPVTDYFSLDFAAAVATIRVFALDGREVARFEANDTNVYSLQNQPAGNYILALEDKNGRAFQAMEVKKQ